MQLTGRQVAQIIDALLAAYSKDSLRELVRVELDATLESIAGGDNLRVVVFNLVSWAEQHGRIDDADCSRLQPQPPKRKPAAAGA